MARSDLSPSRFTMLMLIVALRRLTTFLGPRLHVKLKP